MYDPRSFLFDLSDQPQWVVAWVGILVLMNLFAFRYRAKDEAKIIIGLFFLNGLFMLTLHSIYGYSKILGLGHFLWLFLLPYLVSSIKKAKGEYQAYLIAYSITISISLGFDIRDVFIYLN